MEAADQVLAPAGIDARSCRRRSCRPAPAAWWGSARSRCRAAGSLAAKPARSPMTPPPSATSIDAALDARRQQPVDHLFQMLEALGLLARRQDDARWRRCRRWSRARVSARQMQLGHRAVGETTALGCLSSGLQMHARHSPAGRGRSGCRSCARPARQRRLIRSRSLRRPSRSGIAAPDMRRQRAHHPLQRHVRRPIHAVDGDVGHGIDGIAQRRSAPAAWRGDRRPAAAAGRCAATRAAA